MKYRMHKAWERSVAALLMLCAVCVLSACGKTEPKGTPVSVDYSTYRSDGQGEYEIAYSLSLPDGGIIGEDGVQLSVRSGGAGGYQYSCILNGDVLHRAGEIIDENSIAAWDGFDKARKKKDTENSFSLTVRYPDGSRIVAAGINAFPKNWDKSSKELSNFFEGLLDEETITSLGGTRTGEWAAGGGELLEDVFTVSVAGDSTAMVTGYIGNAAAVTVPDAINGHIVAGLGDRVFAQSAVVSVSMGSYVTYMGEGCFENCARLSEVQLPTELVSVPRGTFAGCVSLGSAALPAMVKSVEPQVFEGCSALSEVSLNEGLLSIGSRAFAGCSSLSVLNIPYSVTYIAEDAFTGCSGDLKLMVYPDSFGVEYAKANNIKYEEYKISGGTGAE